MTPILCIVGKSDTGKTTLLERLIPVLVRRGRRIGTVKHDTHGFQIDREGKDTWRHRQAGSRAVAIVSPACTAVIREEAEQPLERVVERYMDGVDLILCEGFKSRPLPKVEVSRRERSTEILSRPEEGLLAVVADHPLSPGVPVFEWDQVEELADLLEERFPAGPEASGGITLSSAGQAVRLNAFVETTLRHVVRGLVRGLKDVPRGRDLRMEISAGPTPEVSLVLGGAPVPLKPFVARMMASVVRGAASSLDGIEPGAALEVELP